jgi:hypothetical protein
MFNIDRYCPGLGQAGANGPVPRCWVVIWGWTCEGPSCETVLLQHDDVGDEKTLVLLVGGWKQTELS